MAVERKNTEKLIDELMVMDIPAYKPSANHVQLTDTGISVNLTTHIFFTTVWVTKLLTNSMCYVYHCQLGPMSESYVMS